MTDFPRSLADGAAASDSLARASTRPRSLVDGASAADTLNRNVLHTNGGTSGRLRTASVTPALLRAGTETASRGRSGWCVPQIFDGLSRLVRWRVDDLHDGTNWVFEINPSVGGSAHAKRTLTTIHTTAADGTDLVFQAADEDPEKSQFVVVVPSVAQYQYLKAWRQRTAPFLLTDDLYRRSIVTFTKLTFSRAPKANNRKRQECTVDYTIMQRLEL